MAFAVETHPTLRRAPLRSTVQICLVVSGGPVDDGNDQAAERAGTSNAHVTDVPASTADGAAAGKGGKKAKAMKGMKRRAMRKKKAAAAEEAPMKAMRRK